MIATEVVILCVCAVQKAEFFLTRRRWSKQNSSNNKKENQNEQINSNGKSTKHSIEYKQLKPKP